MSVDAPSHPARPKLPILSIFAIWTLWGVWSAQQSALVAMLTGQPRPTRFNPWTLTMATAWFWALLTPVLMWVARRIRDRIASLSWRTLAHVGTYVIVHLVDVTVY